MRYRNVSGHPEDLDGGRVVGTGERFDLSKEELESEFNKRKISEGKFREVGGEKQEAEDPDPERTALLAEANELKVKNADKLDNDKLAEAVAKAKEGAGS